MEIKLSVVLKDGLLNVEGVPDSEDGFAIGADILLAAARMMIKEAVTRAKSGGQPSKIIIPNIVPPKGPIRLD